MNKLKISQNKFAVGDRVVVVKLLGDGNDYEDAPFMGTAGEVLEDSDIPYVLMDKTLSKWPWEEEQLEFEHIVNSPLYKALS